MVVIPAGEFQMGDMHGSGEEDEQPVHQVIISKAFEVGKYPVTRGEFSKFIEETNYSMDGQCYGLDSLLDIDWKDPGFPQTERDPVVCVSWLDANEYIKWLNQKTGLKYRLLTEAEWEYVGRAGTATKYSFGNEEKDLCQYANGADASITKWPESEAEHWAKRNMTCNDGYGMSTSPVGTYAPNAFGVYDMQGNVWEWVEDCWDEENASYKNARSDTRAYISKNSQRKVNRGGSWDDGPWGLRLANRGHNSIDTRYNALGFRLARDIE